MEFQLRNVILLFFCVVFSVSLILFFLRSKKTLPSFQSTSIEQSTNEDITFELLKVEESEKLGDVVYIVRPNGIFLTFFLKVENRGPDPIEIDLKSFAVVTGRGQTHSISPEGQSGRNINENSVSFFKQEIPTNGTLDGQVTFDVLNPDKPMKLLYKGDVILENIVW